MAKYEEGSVSPSGKYVVQGGKWVPVQVGGAPAAVQQVSPQQSAAVAPGGMVQQGVENATGPPTLGERALPYVQKGLEYAALPFKPLTAAVDKLVREPLKKLPVMAYRANVPFEATQDPMAMAAGALGRGEGLSGEMVEMPSMADTTATLLDVVLSGPYGKLLGQVPGRLAGALGTMAKDARALPVVRSLPGGTRYVPPTPTMSQWGEAQSPLIAGGLNRSYIDVPPQLRGVVLPKGPIPESNVGKKFIYDASGKAHLVEEAAPAAAAPAQAPSAMMDKLQQMSKALPQSIVGAREAVPPQIEPFQRANMGELEPMMDAALGMMDRSGLGLGVAENTPAPLREAARSYTPLPQGFVTGAQQHKRLMGRLQPASPLGHETPSRMPTGMAAPFTPYPGNVPRKWQSNEVLGLIQTLQLIGQLGK